MMSQQNPEGIAIEFVVPANFGICYLEAALRLGLNELQNSKRFIDLAGNVDASGYMGEAQESMAALLSGVMQVKQNLAQILQSRSQDDGDDGGDGGSGAGNGDDNSGSGGNIAFASLKAISGEGDDDSTRSPLED